MKRAALLIALILCAATASAQSLKSSADDLKVELRDLFQSKKIGDRAVNEWTPRLAEIYQLEEELSPTGRESQPSMGERCNRAIKAERLQTLINELRGLPAVRNKRARKRLAARVEELWQSSSWHRARADTAPSCRQLRDAL